MVDCRADVGSYDANRERGTLGRALLPWASNCVGAHLRCEEEVCELGSSVSNRINRITLPAKQTVGHTRLTLKVNVDEIFLSEVVQERFVCHEACRMYTT